MIKAKYKKIQARRLIIEMPKDINDYALVFLQLFNNAREYPESIMLIENNSGNQVFITCPKDSTEEIKDWINSFKDTKVIDIENIDRFVFNIFPDKEEFCNLFGYENDSQYVLEVDCW